MAVQSDANAENAAKDAVFASISKLEEIGAFKGSMFFYVCMTFIKDESCIDHSVYPIINDTNIAERDKPAARESLKQWILEFQKSIPDLKQEEIEDIMLEIRPDIARYNQHIKPPDSSTCKPPVSAPIPEKSHIEEKFDESQFSPSQIESMLELGRFLYRNKFKLEDRDSALRFVSNLMKDESELQAAMNKLKQRDHTEFHCLLNRCVQCSKSDSADSPRELNSRRIIDGILKILSANQIPIPSDIDSFIFKLSTLSEFRSKICSKFNEKARAKISQLCNLLLKIEGGKMDNAR